MTPLALPPASRGGAGTVPPDVLTAVAAALAYSAEELLQEFPLEQLKALNLWLGGRDDRWSQLVRTLIEGLEGCYPLGEDYLLWVDGAFERVLDPEP